MRERFGTFAAGLRPTSPWSVVPGLRDLRGATPARARRDAIPALTVAAVAIPAGLGMAELAGMPVRAGRTRRFVETGFVDVLGRENVFPTVRAGVSAFVAGERPSSELLRGVFAATITAHVVEGSA